MQPTTKATAGDGQADSAPGDSLDDYDYSLPEGRIALRPVAPRDSARLLVSRPEEALEDRVVRELPDLLRPGDRLVVNDSRVIPAQLTGRRARADTQGASVSLTLIARLGSLSWRAFAKPAKRLRPGDTVTIDGAGGAIAATVEMREGAQVHLRFNADPLLAGHVPLPPYIAAKRAADSRDESDYQTVYAQNDGSVAAPTAGLHFTDALIDALANKGIGFTRVTLHVGAGTFLPVTAGKLSDHKMHAEWGEVAGGACDEIARTRGAGGRIICVGTTALRLVETAAARGTIAPFVGETTLFIRPGFKFHAADGLMTNFHLPRSTLLMLVAAFVGFERMRAIYDHALSGSYRFFSYGDASLLWRA